jgi:hypothetical protein
MDKITNGDLARWDKISDETLARGDAKARELRNLAACTLDPVKREEYLKDAESHERPNADERARRIRVAEQRQAAEERKK